MKDIKRMITIAIVLAVVCFSILGDVIASVPSAKVGVVGAANQIVSAIDIYSTKRTLSIGNDIFFNEKIHTNEVGSAQLLFLDKSALTVGPNSSLTIDKFVYNPINSSGQLVVNGAKGIFRFIGGALSKKKPVRINTPVGTIGIRGGIVLIEIDPFTGRTDATFIYGEEMIVQNKVGDVQVTTRHGFGITIATATTPPTAPVLVDPGNLALKINSLEGKSGTNAGAAKAPTKAAVISKLEAPVETEDSNQESESNVEVASTTETENSTEQQASNRRIIMNLKKVIDTKGIIADDLFLVFSGVRPW